MVGRSFWQRTLQCAAAGSIQEDWGASGPWEDPAGLTSDVGWEGESCYNWFDVLETVKGLNSPVFSLMLREEGLDPGFPGICSLGGLHRIFCSGGEQLLTAPSQSKTADSLLPAFAQGIPALLFAELTARST